MEPNKEEELAAKREARRRRIVDNAKNRLTRITGRELNDEETQKINCMATKFCFYYRLCEKQQHSTLTNSYFYFVFLCHKFQNLCSSTTK